MNTKTRVTLLHFLLPALALAFLWWFGATAVATAAPATQTTGVAAVAKYDQVNVRSGPSTAYGLMGTLTYGQTCPVLGRDTVTGWWLIQCSNGVTGWVSYDLVNIIGDAASVPQYSVGGAPVAPPESQAPAQPTTFNGWKASYYANKDLAGTPVLVQDVPDINFDWGGGSPGPTVPVDYFSARYERTLNLAPGNYLLTLRMDDGARVYVDDQLVLDDWRVGPLREINTVRALGGANRFRVEYFEDTGAASIFFSVLLQNTPAPQPTPVPWQPSAPDLAVPQEQWRAQYYNNTDLAGPPVVAQYEPRSGYMLDKNWGNNAPVPGINPDYWSARFEGYFYFALGNYVFYTQSDDGVRLWIDNILVIDAWYDGYKEKSNTFNQIGAGNHDVRIEFYDRTGAALLRAWWTQTSGGSSGGGGQQPVPPPPSNNPSYDVL